MVCGIVVHQTILIQPIAMESMSPHSELSKIEFHGSSAVQLELKLWYIPKITVNSL